MTTIQSIMKSFILHMASQFSKTYTVKCSATTYHTQQEYEAKPSMAIYVSVTNFNIYFRCINVCLYIFDTCIL